jgi:hypothetical protein
VSRACFKSDKPAKPIAEVKHYLAMTLAGEETTIIYETRTGLLKSLSDASIGRKVNSAQEFPVDEFILLTERDEIRRSALVPLMVPALPGFSSVVIPPRYCG